MLHIIDVGAHIGDCCLWAAARFRQAEGVGVRCLAVETEAQTAAVIRHSVWLNHWEDSVEVLLRAVGGAEVGCPQTREPLEMPTRGDCLVEKFGHADMISIFTGGGFESAILEG